MIPSQSGIAPFSSLNFTPAITPPAGSDEPAIWLLFQRDDLVVQTKRDQPCLPQAVDPGSLGLASVGVHYLGYVTKDDGHRTHCFSGDLDEATQLPDGFAAKGLRSLFGQLSDIELALAGRAVQIVNWERTHRFCGRCGSPTQAVETERAKLCPNCGLSNYPRLSPAIIIAITRQTEDGPRILLARNHRFPNGRYSVIAGFVEPGESLEECAHREVYEEVGLRIRNIRYFGSQPWPFPNSLMIGFTAEYAGGDIVPEEGEIADARWFAPDALPQVPPKVSIARRLIDAFVAENGGAVEALENW